MSKRFYLAQVALCGLLLAELQKRPEGLPLSVYREASGNLKIMQEEAEACPDELETFAAEIPDEILQAAEDRLNQIVKSGEAAIGSAVGMGETKISDAIKSGLTQIATSLSPPEGQLSLDAGKTGQRQGK